MSAAKDVKTGFRVPLDVEVPASTSNLGTGFDCLGLALDLALKARLLGPSGAAHEVERTGEGAGAVFAPGEDLFLVGFERGRELLPFEGHYRFALHSEIPMGRGLGSSAAALSAGLFLARALAAPDEDPAATQAAICNEVSRIEGHHDNAAAAVYGGCALGVPLEDGSVSLLFPEIAPQVGLVLTWPERTFSTHASRGLLPEQVSFADAVENPRRLAFLLEGLRTANADWVRIGIEDRLHVPYRLAALEEARAAIAAAEAAGAWGATLSGAGSGVVVVCAREDAERIARALPAEQTSRVVGPGTAPLVHESK